MKELTIQYVSPTELQGLASDEKIEKLLSIVKEDKIALVQGRLKKSEEVALIAKTMENIDKKFKGIEIAVLNPTASAGSFYQHIKAHIAQFLLGHQPGITVIGPATVIREIKQDPNKIQLYTIDKNK